MKLAYSPASPYVRKVTACAIKRGIDKQIERIKISTTDPELLKYTAIPKCPRPIPAGAPSPFNRRCICEPSDSVGSAQTLSPARGRAPWRALTRGARAEGTLDAPPPRRRELPLPQDEGRKS